MADDYQRERFPSSFNDEVVFGLGGQGKAFFGLDVLRHLVDGIDDFIRAPRHWRDAPALLGSAMWINDENLIDTFKRLSGVCIVVRKQKRGSAKLARLREINEEMPGLEARAFAGLAGLAPKDDESEVAVVGGPMSDDLVVPTIRTIGFRGWAPIIHAKLALLGDIRRHDEDALGNVADVIWFKPRRLWLGSPNFTTSSRLSLEFGCWTDDAALLQAAQDFLIKLIRSSEGLDPEGDIFEPDLAPIEFDEQYIAEFMSDVDWDESDE